MSMDMTAMCNINLLYFIVSVLDAGVVHVLGCAVGGLLPGIGFGAISNVILKKTSLV